MGELTMRRFVEGMNKMKFLISIFLCLMCVLFFTISNHQTVFGIGPTAEQPEANVLVADDGQTLSIAVNSQNSINENSKKTENELSSSSRQQRTKTSAKRKRRAVLSLTDMISIVQYHNDYRRQVGASNMQMMQWNPTLAILANNYSMICDFSHGQVSYDTNLLPSDWLVLGQNLAAVSNATVNLQFIVDQWYGEVQWYDYNTLSCQANKICGHYTQLVWAETTDVGCAMTFCPNLIRVGATNLTNANFIVCNYGSAGNIPGQKPYLVGSPCTQCSQGNSWCDNGLCSPSCTQAGPNCECMASCNNCGTANCATCQCSCSVGFMGMDCSDTCRDINTTYCNKNPGWPPSLCTDPTYGAAVAQLCPLMCGVCVAGTPTCTSSIPSTCSTSSTASLSTMAQTTPAPTSLALTSQTVAMTPTQVPITQVPTSVTTTNNKPSTLMSMAATQTQSSASMTVTQTQMNSGSVSASQAISSVNTVMTTAAQTAIAASQASTSATTQAAGMTSSANGAMTSQSYSSTTITSVVGAASSTVTTQGGATSSSATTSAVASSTTKTSTGGATSSTTILTTSSGNSGNNDNCAGRQCLHNGRAVVLSDGSCYCWCPNNQYIGDLCQYSQQEANDGVMLAIASPVTSSTVIHVWDTAWPLLSPIIVGAINDYCNAHLSQCCPNLAQSTTGGKYTQFVDGTSLHVGQGYPTASVSRATHVTLSLIWATASTNPQYGCSAVAGRRKRQAATTTGTTISQNVLYNSMLSAQANLAQTLQSCCQSTVTVSLPYQYPVNSGFPLWGVAVIGVVSVIVASVIIVCCLWCVRRSNNGYFKYGDEQPKLRLRRTPYDADYYGYRNYFGYDYDRDRRYSLRRRPAISDPKPEQRTAPHMLMPVYVREPVVAVPKLDFARVPQDTTEIGYISRQRRIQAD